MYHVRFVVAIFIHSCMGDVHSDTIVCILPCSCASPVSQVEIIRDMNSLYVSPLTLQGFRTKEELQEHLHRFQASR